MKILMRENNKGKWKTVESSIFRNESDLQQLIAEEPGIVSLSEIKESSHDLAIAMREFPVSIGSIDILGFTKSGDIAILECKLATNSEIKRKVIGQVLEYGASLWNMSFEELDMIIKQKTGLSLITQMKPLEDPEWDEITFKENVSQNLLKGNFLLIIVVDQINEELSKIISFLNSAGEPAFALAALEVRKFSLENKELLMPHIYGLAEKQRNQKSETKNWDESSFFEDLSKKVSTEVLKVIRDVYLWSTNNADEIHFGVGTKTGTFTFYLARNGIRGSIFSVYSQGLLCLNFGYMNKILSPIEVNAFRDNLANINGLKAFMDRNGSMSYPSIDIEKYLLSNETLEQLKEAVLEIKRAIN